MTTDTNDRFALLRERLQTALDQTDTFVEAIDLVAQWPDDEDEELALSYLLDHILSHPSHEAWRKLLKIWRKAFGNPEEWPRRELYERTHNKSLQAVSNALLERLSEWPKEYRTMSRKRSGHPMWSVTHGLVLLHIEGVLNATDCEHIQHLVLRRDPILEDEEFHVFQKFYGLRSVSMRYTAVTSVAPLGTLTQLKELELTSCYNLQHLQGLEALTDLERLDLSRCESLVHIEAIAELERLSWLDLSQCPQLNVTPETPLMTNRDEVQKYQQQLIASSTS